MGSGKSERMMPIARPSGPRLAERGNIFSPVSSNMHHSHHFKINFAHSHMHDTIIPSPISQFQTSEHVKLANTQPLMHYPTPFYLTLHNCFLTTLTESNTRIVVALSKQRLAQHRLSHAVSRSALPRA